MSVPGWSGAGYIITDPVTGDGAYKIGGGANGSFYLGVSIGMAIISYIIIQDSTVDSRGMLTSLASEVSAVLLATAINLAVIGLFCLDFDIKKNLDTYCLISGICWSLSVVGLGARFGLVSSNPGDFMTLLGFLGIGFTNTPSPGACLNIGFGF